MTELELKQASAGLVEEIEATVGTIDRLGAAAGAANEALETARRDHTFAVGRGDKLAIDAALDAVALATKDRTQATEALADEGLENQIASLRERGASLVGPANELKRAARDKLKLAEDDWHAANALAAGVTNRHRVEALADRLSAARRLAATEPTAVRL